MFAFSACTFDCLTPENPRGSLTIALCTHFRLCSVTTESPCISPNCLGVPISLVPHLNMVLVRPLVVKPETAVDLLLASWVFLTIQFVQGAWVTPYCDLISVHEVLYETLNLERGENKRPHNVPVHKQSALFDSTTQGKHVCDGASLLDLRVCVSECFWCSSLYSGGFVVALCCIVAIASPNRP